MAHHRACGRADAGTGNQRRANDPGPKRAGAGTDVEANVEGRISVTPLRADLTAHDMLAPLRAAFAGGR